MEMPQCSRTEFQLPYALNSLRAPASFALDSRVPESSIPLIFVSLLVVSVEEPIL